MKLEEFQKDVDEALATAEKLCCKSTNQNMAPLYAQMLLLAKLTNAIESVVHGAGKPVRRRPR